MWETDNKCIKKQSNTMSHDIECCGEQKAGNSREKESRGRLAIFLGGQGRHVNHELKEVRA